MKNFPRVFFSIFAGLGRLIRAIHAALSLAIFALVMLVIVAFCLADRPRPIEHGSLLTLNLTGDVVEEKGASEPLIDLARRLAAAEDTDGDIFLPDVIDAINAAAADPHIAAIVLKTSGLGQVGIDQLHSIGIALQAFRKTGRKVIAADEYYGQKQYYLASFADTIILNPMGAILLHGFGTYPLYFQEALEKLRIHFHVFRVGAYKSATEPLTRNAMSDEVRRQNSEWLSSLWQTFSGEIEKRRGLPAGRLQACIDQTEEKMRKANGDAAKMAKDAGLADKILSREETLAYLETLGIARASGGGLKSVSLKDYAARLTPTYQERQDQPGQIGIIVAEGQIVAGRREPGRIGGDSLAEMIRTARANPNLRAVVLRINSGGGSAFASETIRQALLELKKSGKKLVISMGPVAASGAYWLAANADEIWAAPTTLTGSIGIFGAIPTFADSLAALGVHSDGVGTSEFAAGLNLTRELPPALAASIQLSVENGYRRFISIVAEGRKMRPEAVLKVAEGRVFSGRDAQKLHLVDKLGGLDEAVAAAAGLCNLKRYRAVYVKEKQTFSLRRLLTVFATAQGELWRDPTAISIKPLAHSTMETVAAATRLLTPTDPNYCYALTMARSPLR
ncbi:MAG: signal peptide peptidase SppA [Desulfobulbaceae bacterium]|nr:signal peptide peptidase SppA [Desulfobulbaceae bacterium]